MNKIFTLIFLLLTCKITYSQLQVKEGSFRHDPFAIMDDKYDHYDGNDEPMALIKISTENINETERMRLTFRSNRATQIVKKYLNGQVWLYLSKYADFLEISHPDYSLITYQLPETLCGFCIYEMTLQYVPTENKMEVTKPRNTYLIITSDQDNAIIYIDDEFVGTKEVSKSFDIGTQHTWKIECNMYHTETGTVTLNDKTVISKELNPNFGYINVTSFPENGAKVFVDGEYVGKTPCKTERLRSGSHVVKVVKEMYNSNEQTFVVADGETTEAKMEMIVNFVRLTINTDSESDIYVDEVFKGKGNWSGRLSEGSHYVEARKTSHETSAKNINLTVGKDETIVLEAPKPIYGFLDISTTPIMADIYIDGKHYGTTPNVIDDILVGEHKLMLDKKGYAFLVKDIIIEESETLFLEETFVVGKEIKIITDVNGDSIYVDGYHVGVSPITMNISHGTHDFKAIRSSKTLEQTVMITENSDNVMLMFDTSNKTNGSVSSNYNNSKIIDSKKHSLSIIGGAAMGVNINYGTASYGSDDNYVLPVVPTLGLEYGILNDRDYDLFVNMMYYISKNKRPAFSFMVGQSSFRIRYGVGFCYAEYYESVSSSVEIASIKDKFSFGFLLGGHKNLDKIGVLTCDSGLFMLGNHFFFDLRLGIGLKWKKK